MCSSWLDERHVCDNYGRGDDSVSDERSGNPPRSRVVVAGGRKDTTKNPKIEIGKINSPRTTVKNKELRHPSMEWEKQLRVGNLWWTLRCDHIPQLRNEYKRRSCSAKHTSVAAYTYTAVAAQQIPQCLLKVRNCGTNYRDLIGVADAQKCMSIV